MSISRCACRRCCYRCCLNRIHAATASTPGACIPLLPLPGAYMPPLPAVVL
jgi:hypothetical protein